MVQCPVRGPLTLRLPRAFTELLACSVSMESEDRWLQWAAFSTLTWSRAALFLRTLGGTAYPSAGGARLPGRAGPVLSCGVGVRSVTCRGPAVCGALQEVEAAAGAWRDGGGCGQEQVSAELEWAQEGTAGPRQLWASRLKCGETRCLWTPQFPRAPRRRPELSRCCAVLRVPVSVRGHTVLRVNKALDFFLLVAFRRGPVPVSQLQLRKMLGTWTWTRA